MKHLYKYILFLLLPFLANCSDNENWTIVEDIQQGIYITGTATVYSGEAPAAALGLITLDHATVKERDELVGIYTWLKADGEFTISIAPAPNEVTGYGNGGEIKQTAAISVYSLEQNGTPFKVNSDGFYYVIVNTELNEINILPVNYGVIGAATPKGWDGETALAAPSFNDRTTVTWKGNVNMTSGGYKFRYSGDWGQQISVTDGDPAKIFTDLGNLENAGPLSAGGMTQVRPGGPDFETNVGGEFEFTIQYDLRTRVFNATYKLLGEAVIPPEYPDAMYLVGEATAYGWDTPGTVADAEMHKVAENPGLYWKILSLEGGKGFKISNANWADPNLGFGEMDSFDPDGVAVSDDGGNLTIATSGIYTVVVDLREDETKLSIVPAKVYGMGNAFGGWGEDQESNLFTVNNTSKTLISPALPADGDIRMYVSHEWIPSWWQAEFNVYGTDIIYRNEGGDQEAVPGTTGQVITLHFDDNTGSIE